MSQIEELKNIFEYEIKRKLSERARSSADELRILLNGFKFYDYEYTGRANQTQFVKGILKTGLSGFNESDIRQLFDYYDRNHAGFIDYKNYCNYLYGRETLKTFEGENQDIKQNEIIENKTDENKIKKVKTPINSEQKIKKPINPKIENIPEKQQTKNEIKPEMDSEQTKEYFTKLINTIKNKIHLNNGLNYYSFLLELNNASDENKIIVLSNFIKVFQNLGINLSEEEISSFFNLIDFSKKGKISINEIMNIILDPLVEHRKLYIVDKFAKMDLEKKGEINLSILKERFNPKGHPDVLGGIASVEEIFKQFCYTLDIYCSIKNIKDTITYKQFIEYYSGISSSILDDKYFENMLDGVWDFDQISTDITNDNINNNNNIQEKMNNNFQNKKIDNGFSTDDIGINSLFLGEPTHIMPKSFGKRGFKKRISNNDAQFENNNNIIDNSNQNTRFNQNIKNDKYNNQVPINQENFNVIQNINFNKKTKMKYNPITNEYKTNDMESNSNNLINQNINNKDLDTQNHEKQIKDIIIASLNNFKNILLYIGSHSLFSFLRKLSIYDINHKGVISLEDFLKVSQLYAINLSENELKMIFDLFDKEKSGSINYNELVQTIIGNISVNRENLVKKVYNTFPKNNGDKVSINEIKLLFNYKRHPEVISGKKSEGEIFGEFLNDIENFKEFLENYKGEYDNNLCLDDFIYFYNIVGFGFDDDKMFEYMLNNCWNLDVNDPRFGNYGMRPYRNNIGYGYNKERNFMARAGNQIMNSKY